MAIDCVERKEVDVKRVKSRTLILWVIAGTCCGCQSPSQHTPFRLQSMFSAKSSPAAPMGVVAAKPKSGLPNPAALLGKKESTAHDRMRDMKHPAIASQSDSMTGRIAQRTMDSVRGALNIDSQAAGSLDPTHLQFDPGTLRPELYLTAAQLMEQRGQFPEAVAHYEYLLTIEPTNRAALIGAARLAHRMGNLDQAIAGYQRALTVVGQDPVVLNDLGLCLARAGRHPEAVQTLSAALVANPESLMYRNNLAATLVESQRTDEAVAVLQETHGPAVAHYNVGYMLQQRKQYESAERHFQRVLEIHPEFAPAMAMLDKISPRLGQRTVPNVPYSATQPAAAARPVSLPATVPASIPASLPADVGGGGDWSAQPLPHPLPEVVRYPRTESTWQDGPRHEADGHPSTMIAQVQHVVEVPEAASAGAAIPANAGGLATGAEDDAPAPLVLEPELAEVELAEPELAGPALAGPALAEPTPEPAPVPVIRQPATLKVTPAAGQLIAPSPDNFE
jgi:tetratricopeptide (TPR) repeat protein